MIDETLPVDFAQLLARLGLSSGASAEALERRERDEARARCAAWREAQAAVLPPWGEFARWDHATWASSLDARLRARIGAWEAFRAVDGGVVAPGGAVFVVGPSGAGKSTGVFAALSAQVRSLRREVDDARTFRSGPSVAWATEAALVREQGERQSTLYRRCAAAGVLVLDEVGAGGGHVAQVGQSPVIFSLLAERYDRGAVTSITSGMPLRALAAKYGTGCARRMADRALVIDLFTGV